MTSTTGTAEHPDVSELSDLTEGLLPAARTADVRSHLDGCELCADVFDSLIEIRDALGTLPGPPQMPADIAGRIDAALAAEALLDATRPSDGASATPVAESAVSRETEPRVSRETATDAPPVGATAGSPSAEAVAPSADAAPDVPPAEASTGAPSSVGAPDRPADRPAGRPRAATGPGRGPGAARRRRRNVAGAVIGAVATVAAISLGALMLQNGSAHTDTSTADATGHAEARTFSGGPLEDEVASLLSESSTVTPKASKPSFDTESTQRTPRSNSPMREEGPDVPKCVTLGIGQEAPPLAAKQGSYEGKDAYLVVLPDTSDASRVTAYVVDATCASGRSGHGSGGAGEVLLTRSYPRS